VEEGCMLDNFFIDHIPEIAIKGVYNWWIVALSFGIAAAASFIAYVVLFAYRCCILLYCIRANIKTKAF